MHSLHLPLKSIGKAVMRTLIALLVLLAAGCDNSDFSEPVTVTPLSEKAGLKSESMNLSGKLVRQVSIIAGLTVDDVGNTINPVTADPATLLYYRRTGLPSFSAESFCKSYW
jgi:hypothetical protein